MLKLTNLVQVCILPWHGSYSAYYRCIAADKQFFFTLHKFACCRHWSHWFIPDKSACFDWKSDACSAFQAEKSCCHEEKYLVGARYYYYIKLEYKIHRLFCINFRFTEYIDWIYIFFIEVSFIKRKPGHLFLWKYTWSGPDKCVLSTESPGDCQLYEQCLQCSLIDWVSPSVAKCTITAESHDNVIHLQWKAGPAASIRELAFHIITVPCPNICPRWKLASAIFSAPVQLYIGQESHLHFLCYPSQL